MFDRKTFQLIKHTGLWPIHRPYRAICAAGLLALAVVLVRSEIRGQQAMIDTPTDRDPISISADYSHQWEEGGESVRLLRGRCKIVQGEAILSARQMVVWQTSRRGRTHIEVYLEDDVRVDQPGSTLSRPFLFINLVTGAGVGYEIRVPVVGAANSRDALYERAIRRRQLVSRSNLQQTQLVIPGELDSGPQLRSVQVQPAQQNLRRIRVFPRSAVPYNVLSFESTATTPAEQIWVLTGGINLLIDGVEEFGTVDLASDRMVIWTEARQSDEFSAETLQTSDTPFQVYLEGNIVIRQGKNILRATRAYYDAREDRALLLDAQLRSFIPQLQGDLRLRAKRLRQRSQNSFHAQQAWVTASEFGKPGYRMRSTDIFLDQRYSDPGFGPGAVDPATGAPIVEETPWITSLNNTFLIGDFPVLYSPYLSAPAENPTVPIRSLTFKTDNIFGTQARVVWDLPKLLGIETPRGVDWRLLTDYLSDRGPAIGTEGYYRGKGLFGFPGEYFGRGIAYYINDDGTDNLGLDRRTLSPKNSNRGRLFLRHRQELPFDTVFQGELGYLSDRNFLEQYYENEFDLAKDNETLLYLKQNVDNWAWSLFTRAQVNDFSNTTEWFPRGDLYGLSEPVFNTPLTWSSHTSAGYGQLRAANAPSDPADVFTSLPYVANVGGAVLMSRHELNLPLNVGPGKIVPYVMGEAAFWGEDFTGNSLNRLVGSAGVRGSILFWKVFPYVHNRFFGLNGLAHKMVFDADYSFTDVSEALAGIPQYNEFDDNAQERFRERFLTNTFGGVLPTGFEPRFYAVRNGTGRAITAPYNELIDSQQVLRLGWRHRLQTKAGPPQRLRIKDWMRLDLETSYFPSPNRDNFGEDLGLLGARYLWNVGDRTSVFANAQYDLFAGAQELWNIGLATQRSMRGSAYVGVSQVKGLGINSQILSASYTYKMSEKWISTLGTSYDLGERRNQGQSLTLTRVGADFLLHFGTSFDQSKGNSTIAIAIEPRIGPFGRSSRGRLGPLLNPKTQQQ